MLWKDNSESHKKDDFLYGIYSPPGGGLEEGESVEQFAVREFFEETDMQGHSLYQPYDSPSSEPVAKKLVWVQSDKDSKPRLLRIGDKSKENNEEPADPPEDLSDRNNKRYWQWKLFYKSRDE